MNTQHPTSNQERSSWQVKGDSAASWQPPGSSFTPGDSFAPTTKVEVSVRCNNLADMDTFSLSDPFCVLYMENKNTGNFFKIDRTETIDNTLNPAWQKKFVLDYQFETRQLLKFEVYDEDSKSARLEDHDFIGSCRCSLGEVISAQGRGLTKRLEGEKKDQTITITAEELLENKEFVTLSLSGKKLDRKDWFGLGSSDPFLTISKAGEFGQWTVVHRTEVKKGKLNPSWNPVSLSVSALCNADHSRPLRLTVEDWNLSGRHSMIGELQTSLSQLKELGPGSRLSLVNQAKREKKRSYKDSGKLIINSISMEVRPTFLDYIQNGTELSFTVAIDFTASNGNPNHSTSLHYKDPTGAPNQYMTAIRAVGDIIQDYDTDKMFPALGFGARLPPDGKVSHEFYLNLAANPYCEGMDGVMNAYHQSLNSVQLYGPTCFSYVIRHVARFAKAFANDPSNYFVLLIITDGVITDLEATKSEVIAASSLPMSIIIVGVGSEDFTAMDELDSDDALLTHNGATAMRDIVQFVEMQKFLQRTSVGTVTWNKEMLAREVLFELPEQITGYMRAKGFKPGAPAQGGEQSPSVAYSPQDRGVYPGLPASAPPAYSR